MKTIKLIGKCKSIKHKINQCLTKQIKEKRIKDIQNQKLPDKTQLKVKSVLENKAKNDAIVQSQNEVIAAIRIIQNEINRKELLNDFTITNFFASYSNPKIETNQKLVHKNKYITEILQWMKNDVPTVNPNFYTLLLIRKILKYIENKIFQSLGNVSALEPETLESQDYLINKEHYNLVTISDEELDSIIKERNERKKYCRKIPEKYNVDKMFKDKLKENLKNIKK